MCLQCNTKATVVMEGVLPGYTLMQATEGTERWPAGWYGLVQANDPLLVFPGLVCDPLFESDQDLPPELESACDDFMSAVARMREYLSMSFSDAVRLSLVCREAGYARDRHGDIECWLLHHLTCRVCAGD